MKGIRQGSAEHCTYTVQQTPELLSSGLASSSSSQQENFTSEEHVVKETKTRSVPTYVDMNPRLEPFSHSMSSLALEPVTVRWDSFTPDSISPERKLQCLDQEMQRLASQMNHLRKQSGVFHPLENTARVWNQSVTYPDPDLNRLWNQSALDYNTELNRLWNQPSSYRDTNLALPAANFDPPRGFVRLSPPTQSLVPKTDYLWGHGAHAETWRKKENFHIDNPVVKGRDGQNQFRLEFDLRQFNPDEIEVTTTGHLLTVQAKHEETAPGKKARREYFRQCTVPSDVEPRSVISQLSHSGILSVYAPLSAEVENKDRIIPVKAK